MTTCLISVDVGSSNIKAAAHVLRKGHSVSGAQTLTFDDLSIVASLDDADYQRITAERALTSAMPDGLIVYGGQPYAIGRAARRIVRLPNAVVGQSRYREGWYDVALAYSVDKLLTRAFGADWPSDLVIYVMLMHPPKDWPYKQDIYRMGAKRHVFRTRNGERDLHIQHVFVSEELICGLSYYVLRADAEQYAPGHLRNALGIGRAMSRVNVLLVDVGGNTTDVVPVDFTFNPDGETVKAEPDYSSMQSTVTGTIKVLESFEAQLRSRYPEEFRTANEALDPERLDGALRSGHYMYGTRMLRCADIARTALMPLVNDVLAVFNRKGGAAAYNSVLIIGGGAPLIYEQLANAVADMRFIIDSSNARWINALGGLKTLNGLRKLVKSQSKKSQGR
ncbi:MAG: hypothetical protein KatS3mg038_1032 [Candidatus Kapaibacterium sp.]|nr:MAG: hypothetical protein KatS3mg038_1032 [Candidatus Kapabacteria bacterium]